MDDLIARIRAAIDEDERIARRAADAYEGSPDWQFAQGNEDVEPATFLGKRSLYSDYHGQEGLMPSEVEHVARHDPARVLRDVAKDRAMLDYLEHELHDDETQEWLRDLLRSMATAYGIEP